MQNNSTLVATPNFRHETQHITVIFFLQQSYDVLYKALFFLLMFIFLRQHHTIGHIAIANIMVYGLRYLGIKSFKILRPVYGKVGVLMCQVSSCLLIFIASFLFFKEHNLLFFIGCILLSVILETLSQLGISSYLFANSTYSIANKLSSWIALCSLIIPQVAQIISILVFPANHIACVFTLLVVNLLISFIIFLYLYKDTVGFYLSQRKSSTIVGTSNIKQLTEQLSNILSFSLCYSFILGSIDLLFPAWILLALPASLRFTLLVSAILGISIGFIWLNYYQTSVNDRLYPWVLAIQAILLMGLGIEYFEHMPVILVIGTFVFSFFLVALMNRKYRILSLMLKPYQRADIFIELYNVDTLGILLAMLLTPLLITYVFSSLIHMHALVLFQHFLGVSYERLLAIYMGFLGWLMLALSFAWKTGRCSLTTPKNIDQ